MRKFFKHSALVIYCVLSLSFLESLGQEDVFNLKPLNPTFLGQFLLFSQAGDEAFFAGLPNIAESFYRKALSQKEIDNQTSHDLILKLITVLIEQENFQEARSLLNAYYIDNSPWALREAWVLFYEKDWKALTPVLERIEFHSLKQEERSWFLLLKSFLAQYERKPDLVESYQKEAISETLSPYQARQIEYLIQKQKILNKEIDNDLLISIAKKFDHYSLNNRPIELTKQYAIALYQSNELKKSLEILQESLGGLSIDDKERPQILFLIGLLSGPDHPVGRNALQEVLLSKTGKEFQSSALQLLSKNKIENSDPEFFQKFLTSIVGNPEIQNSLLEEVYLIHMHLELSLEKFDEVDTAAKAFLEKFPGSPLKNSIIRLLAYSAWQRIPPQYLTAIDYLSKLKVEEKKPSQLAHLDLLMADCFFMSQRYDNAATLYLALAQNKNMVLRKGIIVYQLILSYLKSNKIELAQSYLNEPDNLQNVEFIYIWKAQWNLIYTLYRNNDSIEALKYLSQIHMQSMPSALRIRFEWLHAQLLLSTHSSEEALILIDTIFEHIHSDLTLNNIDMLTSEVLLLQARAHASLGHIENSLIILKKIREAYPNTQAAKVAYLEEARYLAKNNNLVEALQLCVDLADKSPNSTYTPIALYEASLYSQLRGQNTSLEQAISFLERLIKDYPNSSLAYYARVKQGDILRQLNQFEAASLVYTQVLTQYPEHPDRYYVKLLEAKSLLALGPKNIDSFNQALYTCEYIADLSNLPIDLRIEAAYNRAFAFLKNNYIEDAQEAYWLIISLFLNDPIGMNMSYRGKYWVSRSIFDLASVFEQLKENIQAQNLYQIIIDYQLQGQALARAKKSISE